MVTVARRQQWELVEAAAAAAMAPLALRAVKSAWRLAAGEDPPADAGNPEVDWGRALAWAAASAVFVAVGSVVARRGAAVVWERVTGERPPRPRRRKRRKRHFGLPA